MADLQRTKRTSNTGEDMSPTNSASDIFIAHQEHVGSNCAKSDAMACFNPVFAGNLAKYAVIVAIPHRIFEVDVGKSSDALSQNRLPV